MTLKNRDTPALLIIDMVRDNFIEEHHLPITPHAKKIITPINQLIEHFRTHDWPIVFSTDAFQKDDFIFTGSMNPHSIAGTEGAEVIDQLNRQDRDLWLPKPRFSAFFDTNLDSILNDRNITQCAIAGISTHFCVLTTAMDALSHDFKTVILEDCTAAFSQKIHQATLNIYRQNPLYPLLRIINSSEYIQEIENPV